MREFWTDTRGNFAIMSAILAVPVIGAAGIAIDYSRALNVKSFIQAETDQAALSGARLGMGADTAYLTEYVRAATIVRYGEGNWIAGLQIEGRWETPTDFKVTSRGAVPVTLLSGLPGFPNKVDLNIRAVARASEPRMVYKAPEVTELDPEASDYNRVSVYCFDPVKNERHHMTAIADNAGSTYTYEMPRCEAGQALSYKLMNVRDARQARGRWDNVTAERHEYYSDTVVTAGVEKHDFQGWDIVETVLCNTRQECRPRSKGGIIPEGRERTPQRASQSCQPGKFMYYGFEDRPPGNGWTDRDYDDIRIIISCPSIEAVGDRTVRLVK
jgi:hypothetical protein